MGDQPAQPSPAQPARSAQPVRLALTGSISRPAKLFELGNCSGRRARQILGRPDDAAQPCAASSISPALPARSGWLNQLARLARSGWLDQPAQPCTTGRLDLAAQGSIWLPWEPRLTLTGSIWLLRSPCRPGWLDLVVPICWLWRRVVSIGLPWALLGVAGDQPAQGNVARQTVRPGSTAPNCPTLRNCTGSIINIEIVKRC